MDVAFVAEYLQLFYVAPTRRCNQYTKYGERLFCGVCPMQYDDLTQKYGFASAKRRPNAQSRRLEREKCSFLMMRCNVSAG